MNHEIECKGIPLAHGLTLKLLGGGKICKYLRVLEYVRVLSKEMKIKIEEYIRRVGKIMKSKLNGLN